MSERPELSGVRWKPDSDVGKLITYISELEAELATASGNASHYAKMSLELEAEVERLQAALGDCYKEVEAEAWRGVK